MVKGELNRLLGRLSRLHMQVSFTEFTKMGITQGQPRILRFLMSHEGCIQREICDACHMKAATVTEVLEKMEDKKLVERSYEPGSRRNLQVFLTPLGHQYAAYTDEIDLLLEDECFKGFTTEEIEQVFAYVERICNNLIHTVDQAQNESK